MDVFELAADGKIGSAGQTKIKKLTPQQLDAMRGRIDSNMDALLPELTDRVSLYLKQKQQDFDLLTERLAAEIDRRLLMSSRDELFQRKLALDLDRQKNDAELTRINQIRASRAVPSDDEFKAASADALKGMTDPANKARGIGQQKANKNTRSQGQHRCRSAGQLQTKLRDAPEEVVRDYAVLTISLRQAGVKNMPEEFVLKGYSSPKKRARMLQYLSERGSVGGWLRVMANSSDRVTGLIDDIVVLRFAHDTAKETYAAGARDVLEFVRNNPEPSCLDDQAVKLFRQFKVALMAQRHYDHVRGAWGRIGQALQGRGFEGPLDEFTDADVVRAVDEAADIVDTAADQASVDAAAKLTPDQLNKDQSFGRILEALDKAQTDPIAAVAQLELEVNNIRITGVEPRKETPQQRTTTA